MCITFQCIQMHWRVMWVGRVADHPITFHSLFWLAAMELPVHLANDTDIYRVSTCDYITFGRLYAGSLHKYYHRFTNLYAADYSFPSSFVEDLYRYCLLDYTDIALACLMAVLWTLLRTWLTNNIFVVGHLLSFLSWYLCRLDFLPSQ